MNIDVSGKVVLVTGASRGIGARIAYALAKEGAYVVINYNNSKEKAQAMLKEIEEFNQNCICLQGDVTIQDDVRRMKKVILERYHRIDVLINNAGITNDGLCSMMSYEQWKSVIDVNMTGVYLCTRYFGKVMVQQKYGQIINIASIKGQVGSEGQCNYSASKAGIIGFTKAVAKEYGPFNISVNALCPGYIKTELNKNNLRKNVIAREMSTLPIDGCMEDLLNFIVFMISDRVTCVSGRVFNLDSRIK